jgi:(S)-2-hydroxyglutarate dehydrogenase
MTYDFAIIGGGIVGLSTGMALTRRFEGASVLVVEKENVFAKHQTGHNSGVIHSGIYYKPGSFKAKFAIEGATLMPRFCEEHGIKYDMCGKIIVATEEKELPLLENLLTRGMEHGLPVKRLGPQQIKEIEPHCTGIAGIQVQSTGICDYKAVARKYAKLIEERGGTLKLATKVNAIIKTPDGVTLQTTSGDYHAKFIINCAGLHCDRVARLDNVDPLAKIVPFRGEYYELKPEKRFLCKNLIYPVPNPDFPFLGVHFTRMTDENIHCGPNAVWAFKREGYHKTDINLADVWDAVTYKGFHKLVMKNFGEGIREIWRSFSKNAFTHSLQRLIPEIQKDDLVPSHAGVRAQALLPDGKMVDDFLIIPGERSMHVCNAPSPGATASIPIGRTIAEQAPAPALPTRVAVGV